MGVGGGLEGRRKKVSAEEGSESQRRATKTERKTYADDGNIHDARAEICSSVTSWERD